MEKRLLVPELRKGNSCVINMCRLVSTYIKLGRMEDNQTVGIYKIASLIFQLLQFIVENNPRSLLGTWGLQNHKPVRATQAYVSFYFCKKGGRLMYVNQVSITIT